ncbi:MAG: DUF2848 family protein [Chloroflexota bacterium]
MLTLQIQGTEETISLQPSRLFIAGFTGRDRAWIDAHMEELQAHGIPTPTRVPLMFPLTPELLTTSDRFHVLGDQTSGEAEFVIIQHHGRIYLAAGSDHTDRSLERTSIPYSKQICPKVISRQIWPLDAVGGRLHQIELRGIAGARTGYQVGTLGEMLAPEEIQGIMLERFGGSLEGAVIFSGTPAISDEGGFAFGEPFTAQLTDLASGAVLRCSYEVVVTPLVDPLAAD